MRTFQIVLVVDLGAHQVLVAHRVDQQLDAVLAHGGVIFVDDFIEGETVLETRATTTLHEHAQFQVGIAFFLDQLGHLGGCAVAEVDRGGHVGLLQFGYGIHFGLLLGLRRINTGSIKSL